MNTARLRQDIDAGKTADKSPGVDIAAAPLGTDEEAAGTPVPPAFAEWVRAGEARPDGEAMSRQHGTPAFEDTTPSGNRSGGAGMAVGWLGVGTVLALALVACIWALVSR
jgi:hypothetical protein